MRKIQRQPGPSTSHPPRNGPNAVATPPSPDHRPTAFARWSGSNDDWISASEPGVSSAPPTPWSARAAISSGAEGARPHSTDATVNHTTPHTKTRRRPKRSPSPPPSRISPARVSM